MSRAPGVERVVSLLDFLATHPDESFGLSDLSRQLGLSKATAHAMVTALTDAGYLLRHPTHKTYSLGPALIAVGHAAGARQLDLVDHARPEMEGLAAGLGVQVVASSVVGDEIVLLANSGRPGPMWLAFTVGQRLPLTPPLGTVFLAWAAQVDIDRWLDQSGPRATADDRERLRSALKVVRLRGYSLNLEAVARLKLGRAMTGRTDEPLSGVIDELAHEEYLLEEVGSAVSHRLAQIAAPVFGADGAVVLALTMVGLPDSLSAEQVPVYAQQLVAAANSVTRTLHGRPPLDFPVTEIRGAQGEQLIK